MTRVFRLLGSLTIAVPLLIAIAGVLAWGTIYETRFGTAAVQRFLYHSWWFQALLAFLAVNLAIAALERYPWKRKHVPFLLAHLGIILILLGGIIGGRFGIEGQLIIPEGGAERLLQLPHHVLVVHEPNPGAHHVFPTSFEATAWVHEPHALFRVPRGDRLIQLVVDRYYPDAAVEEHVAAGGEADNPAVRVLLSHDDQQEEVWLLARDPERFGVRWHDAHLLFLEPATSHQLAQLLGRSTTPEQPRGIVSITVPGREQPYEIPVPERLDQPMALEGTVYSLTFKDYFPDFAITEQGLVSRSTEPNNPAVSFVLSGPEGTDAHLLFAFHPDFPALHARSHHIQARVDYTHPAGASLPPDSITILRTPPGSLAAVLVGEGGERQPLESIEIGQRYTHPWLGYQFEVAAHLPRAQLIQRFTNRGNEVRAQALHLVAQDGGTTADAWVGLRGTVELPLGAHPISVEYRPAQRELPVTITLLDFRKIDYPGTQMASGFESDVELTDPQRGLILLRTIRMNNPLRYRGYSFYQSSYIPGPTETTVLSVRSDPGTPFVYTGFIIVILGVSAMFVLRRTQTPSPPEGAQSQ